MYYVEREREGGVDVYALSGLLFDHVEPMSH